jgi:hypothetical protein
VRIREMLLASGGLLVLDVANEFNDFQTVADAEYGLNRWWVCPPNHINYFSADSLSRLLETCGYRVIRREASFPMEMFLLMEVLRGRWGGGKKATGNGSCSRD